MLIKKAININDSSKNDYLMSILENGKLNELKDSEIKAIELFTHKVIKYMNFIYESHEEGEIMLDKDEIMEALCQATTAVMFINSAFEEV